MRLVAPPPSVPQDHAPTDPGEIFGLAYARWDGAEYPPRSSVTRNSYRTVLWIGPTPPPIDSIYALDNIDLYWKTET